VPLAELLEELNHKARGEAEALLQAARTEAARIAADGDREVSRRRTQLLEARAVGVRARAAIAEAETARQTTEVVLRARTRLVERVLAETERWLPGAVATAEYLDTVSQHVEEVLRYAIDGTGVLRCSAAVAERVAAIVGKESHVRIQPDEAVWGLELRSDDGTVVVDNTLRGRLAGLGPNVAAAIVRRAVPE
jgi:vacuolar-type H+-ATPase subunit E/Vma4